METMNTATNKRTVKCRICKKKLKPGTGIFRNDLVLIDGRSDGYICPGCIAEAEEEDRQAHQYFDELAEFRRSCQNDIPHITWWTSFEFEHALNVELTHRKLPYKERVQIVKRYNQAVKSQTFSSGHVLYNAIVSFL